MRLPQKDDLGNISARAIATPWRGRGRERRFRSARRSSTYCMEGSTSEYKPVQARLLEGRGSHLRAPEREDDCSTRHSLCRLNLHSTKRREIRSTHPRPRLLATTPAVATSPPPTPAATSAPAPAPAEPSPPAPPGIPSLVLPQLVLPRLLQHVVRHSQVLHCVSPQVDLRHPPELARVGARTDDLFQVHVHPVVARHEVTVIRLSVLQFDELHDGTVRWAPWSECAGQQRAFPAANT